MGVVFKNRGWILPPKNGWWKLMENTLFFNGWFGGTSIFGKTHRRSRKFFLHVSFLDDVLYVQYCCEELLDHEFFSRVGVFWQFFVTTFFMTITVRNRPGEQCEEICSHWFDLCLGWHLRDGKCELHRFFYIYGAVTIQADHHRDDDLAVGRKGTKHDAVVHSFYYLIWDAWICLGGEGQRRLERSWQKKTKKQSRPWTLTFWTQSHGGFVQMISLFKKGDFQVPC